MTPDGKRRNTFSFTPFSGGQRVCAGKTFAEYNMRIMAIYISELFDFEFVDKIKYAGKNDYP